MPFGMNRKLKVDGVEYNDEEQIRNMLQNTKLIHDFFTFCVSKFAPENFCAWFMIEVYKGQPRKRMADFLIENYIKDSKAAVDKYGEFTGSLNLPSKFRDVKALKISAKSKYDGIERTLFGKVQRMGFVDALKYKSSGKTKPPEDLFDELQEAVMVNLLDTYAFFKVAGPIEQTKHTGKAISNFKKDITIAGWNTKQLGIW